MSRTDRPEASLLSGMANSRERMVEAFEDAWQRGERPTLTDYLPADGPSRLSLLIELVHSDLEYRLKAGEDVRVEDYVRRYPELAGDTAAIVGLIEAEWDQCRRRGEGTPQEYLDRFPLLAEQLRARLIAATAIETIPYADNQQTHDEQPREPAGGRQGKGPDIPGYEILGELGRGGMGVVYKARHLGLKRFVALKMILAGPHAGPEELARFRTEAESVARLQHANIVQIYDVGEHGGISYFSLEYLGGGNLVRKLQGQPQPGRDAAELIEKLARAMHYAHEQGVVHRDLKPANVLLASDGTPKIADFGLAKRLDDASLQTATGAILGTPCYMAPEQAEGKTHAIGPLTDVYALGALLYELLSGRPPFLGDTPLATVRLVLAQDPVPPSRLQPRVHRDLETICLKALAKEPNQRYESALALAEDLVRFQQGDAVLARRPGAATKMWRKVRRNPLPSAVLAGVLLLLLLSPLVIGYVRTAHQQNELAEVSRQFESELDQPRWEEADYLGRMDAHLEALARLAPEKVGDARQRFHQRFADSIKGRIFAPTLAPDDLDSIRAALDRLAQRNDEMAGRLRTQLTGRLQGKDKLFHVESPFQGLEDVFAPGRVRVDSAGLLPSSADRTMIQTRIPCQGDVEYVAIFSASSWEQASRLGLFLQGEKGYGFVLHNPDQPRTSAQTPHRSSSFAEARRRGQDFILEIQRQGIPVRQRAIKAAEVSAGPLRLEAKRSGDRMLFQVNDLKPLEFQDVFPLGGGVAGPYALDWPGGVRLEKLWAYRQTLAPLSSFLESGDELYAQHRFDEALEKYRTLANTSAQPEVRQQARYKEGLCLLGRNQPDEAAALFQRLAEESSSAKRWPTLARCQLWLRLLGQKRFEEADGQYAFLKGRYSFQELAALLPPDLRAAILQAYAAAAGTKLVLVAPDVLLRHQERNLAVRTFLQAPPWDLLGAKHQLLRACRLAGDEQRAIRLGDEILADNPELEWTDMVRQTLVQHTWALRRVGQPRRALEEVDRKLFTSPGVLRPDNEMGHSLFIERARIHAALQEWKEAEDDLEQFFRLHPSTNSRPDAVATDAALLQGFLRQRRGDATGAQQAWTRVLPSSGIFRDPAMTQSGASLFLHTLILATLTGRLSDEDARLAASGLLSATAGGSSMAGRMTQMYTPPPAVLRRMWQSPRGSEWARRIAYRDLSLADYSRVPFFLLVFEMMHQGALPRLIRAATVRERRKAPLPYGRGSDLPAVPHTRLHNGRRQEPTRGNG